MSARADLIASIDIPAAVEVYMGLASSDPLPLYRKLLAEGQIYQGDVATELLGEPWSTLTPWDAPHFTVLGFEECAAVLRDGDGFSSRIIERGMGKVMGRNILMLDDPDHRIHRLLVQRAFTNKAMDGWRAEFAEPYVARRLAELEPAGEMDFMKEFAIAYPTTVLHRILGLDADQLDEFLNLAAGLFLYATYPEVAAACSEEIADLIVDYVEMRRREPKDDVVGILANDSLKTGETLSIEEIAAFLRLLLPAGAETTTRLLGSFMCRLLAEPGLRDRLSAEPDLIAAATTETLRLDPPFQYAYRLATRKTTLAGTEIPEGAALALCLAAAHRDPRRFPDPDRFDLERTGNNLAFGLGMHICLGVHLSRMEVDVAFREILRRFPKLRLDPEKAPPSTGGILMSAPNSIHLRWD